MRPARRPGVVRELSFAQAAHPALPPLAVSLVVAVLTTAVPAQWPVRTELFQVALAISLYTVAVTMSRITAFVAATLAAAAGQSGWLAAIYEVDRGSGYKTGSSPAKRATAQERPRQNWLFCAAWPPAPLPIMLSDSGWSARTAMIASPLAQH